MENSNSSLGLFKGWMAMLVLITLIVPTFSNNDVDGIAYMFSLPVMVIGLLVAQPILNNLKKTQEMKYDRMLVTILFLWTGLLTLIYATFISELVTYLGF